jgi:hypothetical protein
VIPGPKSFTSSFCHGTSAVGRIITLVRDRRSLLRL